MSIVTAFGWPEWVVAAYCLVNFGGGCLKEGLLHAKGQAAHLTAVGVLVTAGMYGGLAYALHIGGFW